MKTLREYINIVNEADADLRDRVIAEVGEEGLRNMTEFFATGDFFNALNDDESIAFQDAEENTEQDLRALVDNSDDTFETVRKIINWKRPLDVQTVMNMLDNADVESYDEWFAENGIKR